MHHVGRVDWSFADRPSPDCRRPRAASPARSWSGRRRAPSTPSSRSGAFAPGGWLARHVHSFEEALYVLEGELAARARRPRPPPRRRRLRADADRACAHARQRRRRPGPLAVGQHAASGARPSAAARTRSSRRRAARRRGARGGAAAAVRRPDPPVRRPLRRHAAPGRGAAPRRSGARPRAGRAWTRRSWPTAGSP